MRKYFIIVLTSLLLLTGCQDFQASLHIYYSKSCGNCQELEKSLLKKLEKKNIDIVMHDIDDSESQAHYLATLERLEGVELYLKEDMIVPFIALDGYFAMVGYASSMDEIIIQLIDDAMNHQELSLPSGSWLYKDER